MLPSSPLEKADIAACREMLRGGSRSFRAASLLLPRRVSDPAAAIYAFCRVADDAIDDGGNPRLALARLRTRLDRIYAGRPEANAPDRAFAAMAACHSLPRALPDALLDGFDWDAQGRRYESFADLTQYAARVAGSVGAMMAAVMGARGAAALARACDLGVAMQLTNIARDVGEDARAGRLYLPLAWMREAGIDPAGWLERPVFCPALGSVVRNLLHEADTLYARSGAGLAALPRSCRAGIHAAGLIYREIGAAVARADFDSITARARVPAGRKAMLLGLGVGGLVRANAATQHAGLPACQFLVDAACVPERFAARPGFGARAVWVFDLFLRLQDAS